MAGVFCEDDMRPTKDQYMLEMAQTAARRADCMGRKVGAILHRDGYILSTGYNGTPMGMTNCTDGGCERCNDPRRTAGLGYATCICMHAEMNALLTAARNGIRIEGASCTSTLQPCLECLKALVQTGVTTVHYQPPDTGFMSQDYVLLVDRLRGFKAILT
jgi:dCMP deaminase